MRHIRKAAALLLACATQASTATETRAVMHEVFEAIAYLLPRSLVDEPLDGSEQELVASRLEVLRSASAALAEHAGKADAEFGLLARSFGRSTDDIAAAFEAEEPAFAHFAVLDFTQHCAACHSRLPDAGNFDFGQRLMARMNVDALVPTDLAQLYVATRQFDNALDLLGRMVMDPKEHPVDLDHAGTLVQYLNVAISVQQDIEAPSALLARFAEREDLPFYLERRVKAWRAALAELPATLEAPPALATGQALFERASALAQVPGSREGAVYDLAAASVLRQWLEGAGDAPATERAEAFYLLGVIALRTHELRSSVPEMELLFEAAIRAAPDGPRASPAYALLDEYGFLEYGGPATDNDGDGEGDAEGPVLLDMRALRALIGE